MFFYFVCLLLDLDNVSQEIEKFYLLMVQVKDVLECRVESALREISTTSLCDLPAEPCTLDEFIQIADETANKATQSISK
jgi:hypothetical protein